MSKEGSKHGPKVDAANESLYLNVREAKIFLDTNSSIGVDTNVETQVARVDCGTHGIDIGRASDFYCRGAMVAMVLSRVAHDHLLGRVDATVRIHIV
jgi:hypothetical protein